jgi:hypothetical protein
MHNQNSWGNLDISTLKSCCCCSLRFSFDLLLIVMRKTNCRQCLSLVQMRIVFSCVSIINWISIFIHMTYPTIVWHVYENQRSHLFAWILSVDIVFELIFIERDVRSTLMMYFIVSHVRRSIENKSTFVHRHGKNNEHIRQQERNNMKWCVLETGIWMNDLLVEETLCVCLFGHCCSYC